MYQVSLTIVIGIEEIWDTKGKHVTVFVSLTGAGYEKSFCSIKLFFRQFGIKPNIPVIFLGKWKSIADYD